MDPTVGWNSLLIELFFGLNCAQLAPGRAELTLLGLKQIFLIFSVVRMSVSFLWLSSPRSFLSLLLI